MDLHQAWRAVQQELEVLNATVEAGVPVDLQRFAGELGALIQSYKAALELQGKTSVRIECVLKALDLKTPKSELERFAGRQESTR